MPNIYIVKTIQTMEVKNEHGAKVKVGYRYVIADTFEGAIKKFYNSVPEVSIREISQINYGDSSGIIL
jgi:hypothetical protein